MFSSTMECFPSPWNVSSACAAGDRYVTGGLGKWIIEGKYEVWLCDREDSCAGNSSAMCYVFDEQVEEFRPLGLNSNLEFFRPTFGMLCVKSMHISGRC